MKKLIIYTILLSTFIFSCERYIDSRDPIRSLPDTPGAPQNLMIEIDDQSVTLAWSMVSTDGIVQYRVYASEFDTTNYLLVDSTTSMTITVNDLVQNRLYFFVVVGVTSSGLESNKSNLVSAELGVLNMRINSNSDYTNDPLVQLQFTVPNAASDIIYSEDSTFANTIYEPFTTQKSIRLSDGDGVKTVYARIKFENGAETGSILEDDIILDTETSVDSVSFAPSGVTFAPGDTIYFSLFTSEGGAADISLEGSLDIVLSDDGLGFDDVADDYIFKGGYIVPANTNVFNSLVTGSFFDNAGNRAESITASEFLNINTPPTAVELIAFIESGVITFNWTPSTTVDFESYRIYRSSTSGVDENDQLIFYGDFSGTRTFEYIPPFGTSYYRIYVVDEHGVSAGSNIVQITN